TPDIQPSTTNDRLPIYLAFTPFDHPGVIIYAVRAHAGLERMQHRESRPVLADPEYCPLIRSPAVTRRAIQVAVAPLDDPGERMTPLRDALKRPDECESGAVRGDLEERALTEAAPANRCAVEGSVARPEQTGDGIAAASQKIVDDLEGL